MARERRVLATKLTVPSLPPNTVASERLYQQLTRGAANRLTLVSGQPGAGKTFLVASWVASGRPPGPVAWVLLDSGDDEPAAFWRLIAAALEQAVGLVAEVARPRDAPLVVANAVAAHGGPLVLVLDDFHELRHPDLMAQIEVLIMVAPPELRLVVIARSDPHLSLHRYRLDGSLTEIRGADLAFTVGETRALLGESGAALSDEDVALLIERTEGWAAGLRLAGLSLEQEPTPRRFVEDFAGTDRAVADYLMGEVLDRQREDMRAFLLRTSVPDVLTADLAALLSGRIDAARLLNELARANAFVHQRGEDVYRYHNLFLAFLRAELRRTYPDDLARLHRIAAGWLAAHQEPVRAVRHAIAGNDWEQAAQLVAEHWDLMLANGDIPLLRDIDRATRAEAAEHVPELALLTAVDLLIHGEPEAARRHIEHADVLRNRGLGPAREPGYDALRRLAYMYLSNMAGDFESVAMHAEAMLSEAPTVRPHGLYGRRVRASVQTKLASVAIAAGDLEAAEGHLEAALDVAIQGSADQVGLGAFGGLAFVAAARGQLRRAATLATEALERAKLSRQLDALECFPAHFSLGWVQLHWGDLDQAWTRVERAAELARSYEFLPGSILCAVLGARVLGARGGAGASEGLRRLRASREDMRALRGAPFYEAFAMGLEARLLLARGDGVEAAFAALDREGSPERPEIAVVAALLLLLSVRPEEALRRLAQESAGPSLIHPALQIQSLALRALALRDTGEGRGARAALEEALSLGAPDAYRRVYLDCGPPLRDLILENLHYGTGQRTFATELVAAFDARAPAVEQRGPELVEPLSDREAAVLRFLPTTMSNDEIARALYLSVNTVKTHLRHLYGKLGATGRRDAVERSRRMNLL